MPYPSLSSSENLRNSKLPHGGTWPPPSGPGSPGGDTVGEARTRFFSLLIPLLISSLPLISKYPCRNPLSFLYKQTPKPHVLPGSTDTKTYSHNPPANVGHRCPVVCLPHTAQKPMVMLCLMNRGAQNYKAEGRIHISCMFGSVPNIL